MLGSCLRILWQYEWKEWRQLVNSLLELLSRNSHCTVPGSCYLETYIHLQHIPKPTSTKQLWGQPVLELTHPTIIPFYRRKVICPQEPTVYLTSSYKTALLPQGCMNVQIYKHHCSISCLGLWEVACLGLITRGGLNPDRFQLSAKKKWLTSDKYLQALFCAKTGKALWTWEVWLFKCLDFLELHNETVKRLQCKWSWERPHPLFFHSTLADRKMLLGKKFLFNRAHLVIKKKWDLSEVLNQTGCKKMDNERWNSPLHLSALGELQRQPWHQHFYKFFTTLEKTDNAFWPLSKVCAWFAAVFLAKKNHLFITS